jgi:hypothetical protein
METWTMAKAKRARKAETPKQPSSCLRLRAPYLYPDHKFAGPEAETIRQGEGCRAGKRGRGGSEMSR